MFTAAAISSSTEWLNFYYIIFIKRQESSTDVCLFQRQTAALPAPSVQDLPAWKEQVSPVLRGPRMQPSFGTSLWAPVTCGDAGHELPTYKWRELDYSKGMSVHYFSSGKDCGLMWHSGRASMSPTMCCVTSHHPWRLS